MVDLRLAAQEDRAAELAERAEVAQQVKVLLGRLAEADTRVDDEPRRGHNRRARAWPERSAQVLDHLAHDVVVDRLPRGCA